MDTKKAKAWFLVFRPWSYAATLVPFLVGAAIVPPSHGSREGREDLLNTWGDELSGVDAAPGAIRTTPHVHDGTISMRAVLTAATACAACAAALGTLLCLYRNEGAWNVSWPLLAIGFIGFLGATNYSTGIKFKYIGLGVPFVAFLCVLRRARRLRRRVRPPRCSAGSICILRPADATAFLTPVTAFMSIPIASLVCVIMHGNDMRDIQSDRAAGIRTCASTAGPRGALAIYWICHMLPYVVCAMMICRYGRMMLLPFMALPLTRRTLVRATKTYLDNPQNPKWIRLERASGGIHLAFGILYTIALRLTVYPYHPL